MLRRLRTLLQAEKEAVRLREELAEAHKRLERQRKRLRKLRKPPFDPARMVWIFGAGRTGSTWLADMTGDLPGHHVWREPKVGELFGEFYYGLADDGERRSKHFVMGSPRGKWLPSVRSFVLEQAAARFGDPGEGWLVIKEPNGSIGAPLLSEAFPESRLVTLVRDPRDVMASVADAFSDGGWVSLRRARAGWDYDLSPDEQAVAFFRKRVEKLAQQMGAAVAAHETHPGPKAIVRYENLRANTLSELKRIYSELGIPVEEVELAWVVEKHTWENIPEEKKGEGKFYRKASPGSWREDLSPEQVEMVEEITEPIIETFYRE